jgi:hypothetical protein
MNHLSFIDGFLDEMEKVGRRFPSYFKKVPKASRRRKGGTIPLFESPGGTRRAFVEMVNPKVEKYLRTLDKMKVSGRDAAATKRYIEQAKARKLPPGRGYEEIRQGTVGRLKRSLRRSIAAGKAAKKELS